MPLHFRVLWFLPILLTVDDANPSLPISFLTDFPLTGHTSRRDRMDTLLKHKQDILVTLQERQKKLPTVKQNLQEDTKDKAINLLTTEKQENPYFTAVREVIEQKTNDQKTLTQKQRTQARLLLALRLRIPALQDRLQGIEEDLKTNFETIDITKENLVHIVFREFVKAIPKSLLKTSLTDPQLSAFVDEQFKIFVEECNKRFAKYNIKIDHEGGFKAFIEKWSLVLSNTYDPLHIIPEVSPAISLSKLPQVRVKTRSCQVVQDPCQEISLMSDDTEQFIMERSIDLPEEQNFYVSVEEKDPINAPVTYVRTLPYKEEKDKAASIQTLPSSLPIVTEPFSRSFWTGMKEDFSYELHENSEITIQASKIEKDHKKHQLSDRVITKRLFNPDCAQLIYWLERNLEALNILQNLGKIYIGSKEKSQLSPHDFPKIINVPTFQKGTISPTRKTQNSNFRPILHLNRHDTLWPFLSNNLIPSNVKMGQFNKAPFLFKYKTHKTGNRLSLKGLKDAQKEFVIQTTSKMNGTAYTVNGVVNSPKRTATFQSVLSSSLNLNENCSPCSTCNIFDQDKSFSAPPFEHLDNPFAARTLEQFKKPSLSSTKNNQEIEQNCQNVTPLKVDLKKKNSFITAIFYDPPKQDRLSVLLLREVLSPDRPGEPSYCFNCLQLAEKQDSTGEKGTIQKINRFNKQKDLLEKVDFYKNKNFYQDNLLDINEKNFPFFKVNTLLTLDNSPVTDQAIQITKMLKNYEDLPEALMKANEFLNEFLEIESLQQELQKETLTLPTLTAYAVIKTDNHPKELKLTQFLKIKYTPSQELKPAVRFNKTWQQIQEDKFSQTQIRNPIKTKNSVTCFRDWPCFSEKLNNRPQFLATFFEDTQLSQQKTSFLNQQEVHLLSQRKSLPLNKQEPPLFSQQKTSHQTVQFLHNFSLQLEPLNIKKVSIKKSSFSQPLISYTLVPPVEKSPRHACCSTFCPVLPFFSLQPASYQREIDRKVESVEIEEPAKLVTVKTMKSVKTKLDKRQKSFSNSNKSQTVVCCRTTPDLDKEFLSSENIKDSQRSIDYQLCQTRALYHSYESSQMALQKIEYQTEIPHALLSPDQKPFKGAQTPHLPSSTFSSSLQQKAGKTVRKLKWNTTLPVTKICYQSNLIPYKAETPDKCGVSELSIMNFF